KNLFYPALWNPIVNNSSYSDTNQNIWKYFLKGVYNLLFCKRKSFFLRWFIHINIDRIRFSNKRFHFILQMKLFNNCSTYYRNNKPYNHIYDSNFGSKDTHQQNQTS